MNKKQFAVLDSDSHIVETPELWEKYLEPEYRTLGKHALWREEGKFGCLSEGQWQGLSRHHELQHPAPCDLEARHDVGQGR